MGAVRAAGLALTLALAGTMFLGAGTALAAAPDTTVLPPPPVAASLTSSGTGVATQMVTVTVPAAGHVDLLDADGSAADNLVIDGVGSYLLDRSTGVLTFRPDLGYAGSHGVVFRETDAYLQTADATYTALVAVPHPPEADPVTSTGTGTVTQSVTVTVPAQGNAVLIDADGQATTDDVVQGVGEFRIDPATGIVGFAPAEGYTGSPTLDYRVTDAYGQADLGSYTPSVMAPGGPVAVPATSRAMVNVQQVARIGVPVGATLMLLDRAGVPTTHVYHPGQGNYALDPTSETITFTPAQGFAGVGSLTYRLTDAYGQIADNAYTPVVLRPLLREPATALKRMAVPVKAATVMPALKTAAKPLVRARLQVHALPVRAAFRPTGHPAQPAKHLRAAVRPTVVKPSATQTRAAHVVTKASAVVQQLAAAPVASSGFDLSGGRIAGLALIGVNSLVLVAALLLHRRRRETA